MQEGKSKPSIVSANEGEKLQVIGADITVKLKSADTNGSSYVFEAVMPPSASVPPHVHQHEDEFLKILDGEFDLFLNYETYRVTAGAVAFFPRLIPHGFTNVGKTPARILFTVSPAANFEKFFEELSSLPTTQPPDFAKVAEIFRRYEINIL